MRAWGAQGGWISVLKGLRWQMPAPGSGQGGVGAWGSGGAGAAAGAAGMQGPGADVSRPEAWPGMGVGFVGADVGGGPSVGVGGGSGQGGWAGRGLWGEFEGSSEDAVVGGVGWRCGPGERRGCHECAVFLWSMCCTWVSM